jgi:1-acyl-sn-glycerol-3-phosphate acyltransferase
MLRKLFCIAVAVVAPAIFFPILSVGILLTLNPDVGPWVARVFWSPILLWAGGARLRIEGAEHVDPRRPTIYVSNHQSTVDIPALFVALPVPLRFVAKHQLAWVPIIGWYLWLTGNIFVNRSNRAGAITSMERAAQRIRAGRNILVFAEGTRSEDGRILPFKKGAFALALRAGVPICPVTIEGSAKLMPKNSWRITPGDVRVRIGAPIDPAPFAPDDREGLMRAVREAIVAQSLAMGGRGSVPDLPPSDAERAA